MSRSRHTVADEPFFLVRSLAAEQEGGGSTGRHSHGWGQLIYCSHGVMTVWTASGSWVAPTNWAVWAPAGVAHDIRFAAASSLRTLYLRADLAVGLPLDCAAMTVSALLRELILRTLELGMLDERLPPQRAMADLIIAELSRNDAPPFDLPLPASAATRAAAQLMRAPGGSGLDTAALARATGVGGRTLERRFLEETGLSIASWGRQARLLRALEALATGASVKAVAESAGYRSASAFVAAFRAAFGQTPGRYFASTPTAWP